MKVRQESIDLLKGRLKSQIASFKETILESKELRLLPYSWLLGWPSGYLLKHLLPGGRGAVASGGGGESPPKDESGLKEWIRNKLKALASLLDQLGIKTAEALPGIIGGIISWILNRVKDIVGWVSQNLWALVVGIGD